MGNKGKLNIILPPNVLAGVAHRNKQFLLFLSIYRLLSEIYIRCSRVEISLHGAYHTKSWAINRSSLHVALAVYSILLDKTSIAA